MTSNGNTTGTTTGAKARKPKPDLLTKLLRQVQKELEAGTLVTRCPPAKAPRHSSLTKKAAPQGGRAAAYKFETRSEGHALRQEAAMTAPGELVELAQWGDIKISQCRRLAAHSRLTLIVERSGKRAAYTGRLAQHLSDCIVQAAYAYDAGEAYNHVAPGVLTYTEFMERAVGVEVQRLV